LAQEESQRNHEEDKDFFHFTDVGWFHGKYINYINAGIQNAGMQELSKKNSENLFMFLAGARL
jgi:hypothetical protein